MLQQAGWELLPEQVAGTLDDRKLLISHFPYEGGVNPEDVSHLVVGLGAPKLGMEQVIAPCIANQCDISSADFQNALRAVQETRFDNQILEAWTRPPVIHRPDRMWLGEHRFPVSIGQNATPPFRTRNRDNIVYVTS